MSRPVNTADTKRGAPPQRVRIPETLPRDEPIVSPGTSDPNELQQLDVGDAGGVAAGDGGAEHDLGLADPGASWHSHRDQWLALATDTALLVGTAAKIAGDIALMAQTDVGSVTPSAIEDGSSSAMPPFLPIVNSSLACTSQIATSMLMTTIQAAGRV